MDCVLNHRILIASISTLIFSVTIHTEKLCILKADILDLLTVCLSQKIHIWSILFQTSQKLRYSTSYTIANNVTRRILQLAS